MWCLHTKLPVNSVSQNKIQLELMCVFLFSSSRGEEQKFFPSNRCFHCSCMHRRQNSVKCEMTEKQMRLPTIRCHGYNQQYVCSCNAGNTAHLEDQFPFNYYPTLGLFTYHQNTQAAKEIDGRLVFFPSNKQQSVCQQWVHDQLASYSPGCSVLRQHNQACNQ